MKFLEKSLTACFCGLMAMVTAAGLCAAQQPGGSAQAGSAMKKAQPSHLTQAAPRPSAFKPSPLAAIFAANRRSLSAAPPADIGAMLSSANFPAATGRKYSMPSLAKANFLAPTRSQPWTGPNFNAPALKGVDLRPARHPGPGDFQK
ncbi:MAG: hypothetical protein LAP21_03625 [Acidobacteriia bacterium]|nr:hypothetical protein [Terriglobia bacterium]